MIRAKATIAAIATGASPGAIGVVRISGPESAAIVRAIGGKLPPPRYASLQTFRAADGTRIDHGLVLYFPGPASYTGEDMAEFHAHGGLIVLSRLLEAIYTAGAAPAAPGEFSARAFCNRKIDLLQAEAIADLISLSTDRALAAANAAIRGDFSTHIRNLSAALIAIRTNIEAAIDFAEDAISATGADNLYREVLHVRDAISALLVSGRQGALLMRGANVVIVGQPNTGKSTLLNRLAGEDRAIVSPQAGTTRDVLQVDINFDGLLLTVHDTAGIRVAIDEIEREGVRRAHAALSQADVIVYVADRNDSEPDSLDIAPTAKLIRVRNKIDLIGESPSIRRMSDGYEVHLSARTGAGLDLLREAIQKIAGLQGEVISPFLARERHLEALRTALRALDFADSNAFTEVLELTAEKLRQAQVALEELVGEYSNEDLLGNIFAHFCIGK
ncbi:MAG: tRNA uridine-5-carboxymethylaminomethyl(34) synthesis GTPase MnmE [Gammaproteobacteria bacterium]|nr:tRNA uridine-5-carboxymethylaminomethyl(34) synthesis GTPase MnmE [Gammaproteobacteria bacterium]